MVTCTITPCRAAVRLNSGVSAMKRSAVISDCTQYRYELRRIWEESAPLVLFIGLNPSWADASIEDNTSRTCIKYAKYWGFGGLLLANLFAFRSTYQSGLYKASEPVGPNNDTWIEHLQSQADLVVCAWGNSGTYKNRDKKVIPLLRAPHCLIKLKNGQPGHPLYKSSQLKPIPM